MNGAGRMMDLEERYGLEVPIIANEGQGREAVTETIEFEVMVLLKGLGEDPDREGLRKTPMRVAKAFREGTRGYQQKVKDIVEDALFPEAGVNGSGEAGGAGGLVVVRDINLFSLCESCLLPFRIQCHVGYVPSGQRVVGLSKLSRVADVYAKRLQEPKRLADEICWALQNSIAPAGVSVALQCWHIQLPDSFKCNPNPKQGWERASVWSSAGIFNEKNNPLRDEFHSLLKFRGVNLALGDVDHSWCPSTSLDLTSSPSAAMVAAVVSILQSLGEDPSRKELIKTPLRYVRWLMHFRKSSMDSRRNGFGLRTNGFNCDRNEIHSELNLLFCAQCEHHLLPFHGVAHIGFFHDSPKKSVDRSSLQSMVHFYGCKLQVQERLTRQIAEDVYSAVGKGVMVVVEASHVCMISRGIEKVGSSTATMAVMGRFSTDTEAKALFLEAVSMASALRG